MEDNVQERIKFSGLESWSLARDKIDSLKERDEYLYVQYIKIGGGTSQL